MSQPWLPSVGDFYTPQTGKPPTWTKQGPGFVVSPQAPVLYPPRYEGYPQSPFAYEGLYSLLCNHWTNTVEIYKQYNPYSNQQVAIIVCPVCSLIQALIEPADQWWEQWYGLYNCGLAIATLPTAVE